MLYIIPLVQNMVGYQIYFLEGKTILHHQPDWLFVLCACFSENVVTADTPLSNFGRWTLLSVECHKTNENTFSHNPTFRFSDSSSLLPFKTVFFFIFLSRWNYFVCSLQFAGNNLRTVIPQQQLTDQTTASNFILLFTVGNLHSSMERWKFKLNDTKRPTFLIMTVVFFKQANLNHLGRTSKAPLPSLIPHFLSKPPDKNTKMTIFYNKILQCISYFLFWCRRWDSYSVGCIYRQNSLLSLICCSWCRWLGSPTLQKRMLRPRPNIFSAFQVYPPENMWLRSRSSWTDRTVNRKCRQTAKVNDTPG